MKAARLTSLMLVIGQSMLTAAAGYLLLHADLFAGQSHAVRIAAIAGASALIAALCLFPLGIFIDHTMIRLRTALADCVEKSSDLDNFTSPSWLRSVMEVFTHSMSQVIRRERTLATAHRELQIRHNVTESEHRQIMSVLNALSDGVLVTNSFREINLLNHAGAGILNCEPQQSLNQPIDEVIDDASLCRMIEETHEHANPAERKSVEHELAGPTAGERIAYEIVLSCVESDGEQADGVVTILHNISRERELSQMKSDFVSKASHELRTPLSSIRAYVEMLVDGEADDETSRQEFYQVIQNETDRLGRLIDNMLNISRIEAGIVQIERERVDFREIANRAIDTLGPQAVSKNITLHSKCSDVDLTVEGDPDMLYQVVLNLMSNAVKYTPEGGRITISADSDNLTRSVLVSVSDTGLGIPPDSVPKLFEKFYRVESFKRVAKGTGLGLNLCKHIVETVHQGQIGVESELGMGSKFWFSIPMSYAGSSAAA